MTFEEFWAKNYKEQFGDTEPYKSIAEYAWECAYEEGNKNAKTIEKLWNESGVRF